MTIHKTGGESPPRNARPGDAWEGPGFKRVLSKGGSWDNINVGGTHPDELDHTTGKPKNVPNDDRPTEVGNENTATAGAEQGAPPVPSGVRADGENAGESGVGRGPQDPGVTVAAPPAGSPTGEQAHDAPPANPGAPGVQ